MILEGKSLTTGTSPNLPPPLKLAENRENRDFIKKMLKRVIFKNL